MGFVKNMFSSGPKAPDYSKLASNQQQADIETSIANAWLTNPTYKDQRGTSQISQTGEQFVLSKGGPATNQKGEAGYYVPTFTQEYTLSAPLQRAEKSNQITQENLATFGEQQTARANEIMSDPFSISGAPARGTLDGYNSNLGMGSRLGNLNGLQLGVAGADKDSIQKVEDALYSRQEKRLDEDKDALEARLAAQGLSPETRAYKSAMEDHAFARNDARLGAILGAQQEHSRQFGINLQAANFGNQGLMAQNQDRDFDSNVMFDRRLQNLNFNNAGLVAQRNAANDDRANFINEQANERNQRLNEIIGMFSGSQINMPQQQANMMGVQSPDIMGAAQQQFAAEQQRLANSRQAPLALLGAGATLGAGALAR